jgi:hypothetical protein
MTRPLRALRQQGTWMTPVTSVKWLSMGRLGVGCCQANLADPPGPGLRRRE